jgi:hypothetical protein
VTLVAVAACDGIDFFSFVVLHAVTAMVNTHNSITRDRLALNVFTEVVIALPTGIINMTAQSIAACTALS